MLELRAVFGESIGIRRGGQRDIRFAIAAHVAQRHQRPIDFGGINHALAVNDRRSRRGRLRCGRQDGLQSSHEQIAAAVAVQIAGRKNGGNVEAGSGHRQRAIRSTRTGHGDNGIKEGSAFQQIHGRWRVVVYVRHDRQPVTLWVFDIPIRRSGRRDECLTAGDT